MLFEKFTAFLKIADLLKEMKAERFPGVLHFRPKLYQAAHFTHKALGVEAQD